MRADRNRFDPVFVSLECRQESSLGCRPEPNAVVAPPDASSSPSALKTTEVINSLHSNVVRRAPSGNDHSFNVSSQLADANSAPSVLMETDVTALV